MLHIMITLLSPWLLCFSSMVKLRVFLFCRNINSLVNIILIDRIIILVMLFISWNPFLLRRWILKNFWNSRISNRMLFAPDRINAMFYVIFFLFCFTLLLLFTFKIFMWQKPLFAFIWLFLLRVSFIRLEHWILSSFLKFQLFNDFFDTLLTSFFNFIKMFDFFWNLSQVFLNILKLFIYFWLIDWFTETRNQSWPCHWVRERMLRRLKNIVLRWYDLLHRLSKLIWFDHDMTYRVDSVPYHMRIERQSTWTRRCCLVSISLVRFKSSSVLFLSRMLDHWLHHWSTVLSELTNSRTYRLWASIISSSSILPNWRNLIIKTHGKLRVLNLNPTS